MYGAYYDLFITAEQPAAKLTAARGEMRRRGWILPYLGGSLLGRLYVLVCTYVVAAGQFHYSTRRSCW